MQLTAPLPYKMDSTGEVSLRLEPEPKSMRIVPVRLASDGRAMDESKLTGGWTVCQTQKLLLHPNYPEERREVNSPPRPQSRCTLT